MTPRRGSNGDTADLASFQLVEADGQARGEVLSVLAQEPSVEPTFAWDAFPKLAACPETLPGGPIEVPTPNAGWTWRADDAPASASGVTGRAPLEEIPLTS